MSEQPPGSPEQPPVPAPQQERAPATLEQAREELQRLKAVGVEDPEFTEDSQAEQFQEDLAELDAASEALTGYEHAQYWMRRSTMFIAAGYIDSQYVNEAIEFLEQDLGNAQDRGDQALADRIQGLIKECEKLLPHEAEPEVPTTEKIMEALREPGRVPMEVHTMIAEWKSAHLAELGQGAQVLIDTELQIAHLYAESGHPWDAIGSITAALINNKVIKKAKPALKKALEDYREELKTQTR